jgi:hypothetical protein
MQRTQRAKSPQREIPYIVTALPQLLLPIGQVRHCLIFVYSLALYFAPTAFAIFSIPHEDVFSLAIRAAGAASAWALALEPAFQ